MLKIDNQEAFFCSLPCDRAFWHDGLQSWICDDPSHEVKIDDSHECKRCGCENCRCGI